MRFCNRCESEKDDSDFSKTARWCKQCRNEYSRKHYAENKDGVRAYQEAWRDQNRDLHNGYNATYRGKNKDKIAEWSRAWIERNPVASFANRSLNFKRRAGWDVTVTSADIIRIWDEQKGLCALSGIPMKSNFGKRGAQFDSPSIDRIVPDLGYTLGNVRLLCFGVNAGRGTLTDHEYVEVCRAIVARSESAL